jgi:hypothetical protein
VGGSAGAWGRQRMSCDCRVRACVQERKSCLHMASMYAPLEVVKYLHEAGGKELLMLTDKVSACGVRVWCVRMCVLWAGFCS